MATDRGCAPAAPGLVASAKDEAHAIELSGRDKIIASLRSDLRGFEELDRSRVAALESAEGAYRSLEEDRDFWEASAREQAGGLDVLGLFTVPDWVGYVGAGLTGVAIGTRF